MAEDPTPPTPVPPTPPAPVPVPSPGKPPTAADVVLDGRDRELTTRIAELEDKFATEKKLREQAEAEAMALRKQQTPEPKKKGLIERFDDWWEGKE